MLVSHSTHPHAQVLSSDVVDGVVVVWLIPTAMQIMKITRHKTEEGGRKARNQIRNKIKLKDSRSRGEAR